MRALPSVDHPECNEWSQLGEASFMIKDFPVPGKDASCARQKTIRIIKKVVRCNYFKYLLLYLDDMFINVVLRRNTITIADCARSF
ncbi:hypothetical protein NPIL_603861 [Nephila pilipes]|uniref:Uncharacterized protein n=1 Tax=Nephila pilipes TaxID=299642 RepID=A0A8X6N5Y5_NEPPI|nr:hypothetical protein NPIL_603861 [Nephila pilipes]